MAKRDDRIWWAHLVGAAIEWQRIPDARPIVIPGWEYLELCVHRTIPECASGHRRAWHITERGSGALLVTGDTRPEVIAKARARLDHFGRERVDAVIAHDIAEHGRAPIGEGDGGTTN